MKTTTVVVKADRAKSIKAKVSSSEWSIELNQQLLEVLTEEQLATLSLWYDNTLWIETEESLTKIHDAEGDVCVVLSCALDERIAKRRADEIAKIEDAKKRKEGTKKQLMNLTGIDLIVWSSNYTRKPSLNEIEEGTVDFGYIYPVETDVRKYATWLEIVETDEERSHLESVREQANQLIEKMHGDRDVYLQKIAKQKEEKKAQEAEEERKKELFKSELHEIVMEKGDESQWEREEKGLLPESEALALLRDVVFAEFDGLGLDRYRHLKNGDIPHSDRCEDGDWKRPRFQTFVLCALTDTEWLKAKNFLDKKEKAGISLRCHIGWCENCSSDEEWTNDEIQRVTIHVSATWNGRKLSREYFVTEYIQGRDAINERLLVSVE